MGVVFCDVENFCSSDGLLQWSGVDIAVSWWQRTGADLREVQQVIPDRRAIYSLRHEICNLLFTIAGTQYGLRRLAHLKKPIHVDTVGPR